MKPFLAGMIFLHVLGMFACVKGDQNFCRNMLDKKAQAQVTIQGYFRIKNIGKRQVMEEEILLYRLYAKRSLVRLHVNYLIDVVEPNDNKFGEHLTSWDVTLSPDGKHKV